MALKWRKWSQVWIVDCLNILPTFVLFSLLIVASVSAKMHIRKSTNTHWSYAVVVWIAVISHSTTRLVTIYPVEFLQRHDFGFRFTWSKIPNVHRVFFFFFDDQDSMCCSQTTDLNTVDKLLFFNEFRNTEFERKIYKSWDYSIQSLYLQKININFKIIDALQKIFLLERCL